MDPGDLSVLMKGATSQLDSYCIVVFRVKSLSSGLIVSSWIFMFKFKSSFGFGECCSQRSCHVIFIQI